jgi:predicted RNA-binding protein YlqC (UPF0109 family)
MKELVHYLAASLVKDPASVEVQEMESAAGSVLRLKVAKEDRGRIIGKQGRTAKSIRALVHAAAALTDRKVTLEISEDQ